MKKLLLLIPLISLLFFYCSVNETTGLIRITNRTKTTIKNIKIGNVLLTFQVAAGNTFDYWYINISGKITAEGLPIAVSQADKTITLKSNYWVDITAANDLLEGREVISIDVKRNGDTDLSESDWIK
jgi:hypothetical protein